MHNTIPAIPITPNKQNLVKLIKLREYCTVLQKSLRVQMKLEATEDTPSLNDKQLAKEIAELTGSSFTVSFALCANISLATGNEKLLESILKSLYPKNWSYPIYDKADPLNRQFQLFFSLHYTGQQLVLRIRLLGKIIGRAKKWIAIIEQHLEQNLEILPTIGTTSPTPLEHRASIELTEVLKVLRNRLISKRDGTVCNSQYGTTGIDLSQNLAWYISYPKEQRGLCSMVAVLTTELELNLREELLIQMNAISKSLSNPVSEREMHRATNGRYFPIFDPSNKIYTAASTQFWYEPHYTGKQLELRIEFLHSALDILITKLGEYNYEF